MVHDEKVKSRHCKVCDQRSRFTKPKVDHGWYWGRTVNTFGMYSVFWFMAALWNVTKRYRCATCGSAG